MNVDVDLNLNLNATVDVDLVVVSGTVASHTNARTDGRRHGPNERSTIIAGVKVNDHGGVHVQVHVNVDD